MYCIVCDRTFGQRDKKALKNRWQFEFKMTRLLAARTLGLLGSLAFISLLVQPGRAMIYLQTECPILKTSENDAVGVCANSCTSMADCDSKSWCCPNSCGGHQCAVVMASCQEGSTEYDHHSLIPFQSDDPDMCGLCWCQNGEKQCHKYQCSGPVP